MIFRFFRLLSFLYLALRLGVLHHIAKQAHFSPLRQRFWLFLDVFFAYRRQAVWQDLPHRLWRLGPGFVKLGQMLACRPDLIGRSLCHRLSSLHDDLPPLSTSQFQDMLSDLSDGLAHHVFDIHQRPLASGSIAVVYAAKDNNGNDIAIKRLRPAIRDHLLSDLAIIQSCCQLWQKWFPLLRRVALKDMIDGLTPLILKETDLRLEAANLDRFHLTHPAPSDSTAPVVDWKNTNAQTLVMTRLVSVRIDAISRIQQMGYSPQALAQRLAALFFKDIFINGWFHADPHPGNIHLAPDGQIILYDFGVMGWLSASDRRHMLAIMAAIKAGRIDALIALHRQAGHIPDDLSPADQDVLINGIKAALAKPHLTSRIKALMLVMEQCDIQFAPAWPILHKTLLTLEGVLQQLNPETDVFSLFSSELTVLLGSALPFFPIFVEIDHFSDDMMVEMVRDLGKEEYLSA